MGKLNPNYPITLGTMMEATAVGLIKGLDIPTDNPGIAFVEALNAMGKSLEAIDPAIDGREFWRQVTIAMAEEQAGLTNDRGMRKFYKDMAKRFKKLGG